MTPRDSQAALGSEDVCEKHGLPFTEHACRVPRLWPDDFDLDSVADRLIEEHAETLRRLADDD